MGYLLFAKSLKVCPFLIRLNLYPLLGWAFLVSIRLLPTGSRIALFNLWTLVLWSACSWPDHLARTFVRTRLRRPLPRVILLLAGFVALSLAPLYLRLAIPDMRDVGTWGYDQRNYVLTTAGLLDEGLLPRRPDSIHGVSSLPTGNMWPIVSGSLAPATFRSSTGPIASCRRNLTGYAPLPGAFALFPRRAFSSLDTLMASVLRIDPQQAYTLSIWIHHLWLLHIAIIFSRLLRFRALGLIILSLVVVYWPNSHLAVAADNRDQANSLILMFVLFIFGKLREKRFWPTVTCLCAMLVGYPELAIPALVVFYAQRYDSALNWREWLRRSGRELGTSILCILPLLPPALFGLICQWVTGRSNRTLVFPVQYATPLARFDYLPGWKLLWNDSPGARYLSLGVDILILLAAAYGLVMLFRRKQFGTLVGYGAVLACGYIFLYRNQYYPAYKVVTIIWPFFVWIVFLPLARIFSSPPGLEVRARQYRYAFAFVLIVCSLPAIISLAQIPIPGAYQLIGANYFLTKQVSPESFLKPRISDVNRLERISHEVSAKKENVLVIADVPEATPYDFGFAQLLLRNESVFFPKSFGTVGRIWRYAPYPGARAASANQPIDRVLFLNDINTLNFHLAERHIFAGTFDETAFRQMNFCADSCPPKSRGTSYPLPLGDRNAQQ